MPVSDNQLEKLLVEEGYITQEDIITTQKHTEQNGGTFASALLSSNVLSKDILGQAIAEYYGVPYADLNSHMPPKEQVLQIPENVAKELRVVLFEQSKGESIVATDDPSQKGIKTILRKYIKSKKITLAYSLSEDIDNIFVYYVKTLSTRFSEIIEKNQRVAPEIIDQIIQDALTFEASDIHFEPQEKNVLIRFRVDGVLQEAGRVPKQYYDNILNRLKIMARLRIDEHTATQDGAIRITIDQKNVDIRVSIVPAMDGEKVVLRLLAEYVKGFNLDQLGFSEEIHKKVYAAAHKPFGMILAVGPTGSGKTTTLYSLLKLRQHPEVNITTIEDPVEYKISGITQMQVDKRSGISFSNGLRSIVRQDPDIILVGEIRDGETAEIAVNAALTGHLLLSTFHATDAATAIPRLLTMGVEPFLLSSTLELIMAQRLVRKICEHCRISESIKGSAFRKSYPYTNNYVKGTKVTLYKGKGCAVCSGSGYKGRIAITEVIEVTPQMKELIGTQPRSAQIWDLAQIQGAESLYQDGIKKVLSGMTTMDELLRVAAPPS